MPDWITHLAVAWTLCMLLGLRYKEFNTANTLIVLAGALVPDLYKITILIHPFYFNITNLLTPVHLPIGSFIIAGMICLLFKERKMIFLFLSLGVITHYLLDLLLENLAGGMYLFYPLYWGQWSLELVSVVDYHITIFSLFIALYIYFMLGVLKKQNITR